MEHCDTDLQKFIKEGKSATVNGRTVDAAPHHGSREPGQELSGLIGGCPAGYLHIYIFIKIKLNR
jgi:hypothetical protein